MKFCRVSTHFVNDALANPSGLISGMFSVNEDINIARVVDMLDTP